MTVTSSLTAISLTALLAVGCNRGTEGAPTKDAPTSNGPADIAPSKPQGPAVAGHSTPPTAAEWSAVGEVTLRNSGSLQCETKMVREWLRVSCKSPSTDNAVTGLQVIRPTGDREYFVYQVANLASLVMPVREGTNALVRYTWQKWGTRDMTITWQRGAPSASMSFDRGGDATTPGAATGLQCKSRGECPGTSHCCLSASGTACSPNACGVGAEVCTNNEDCELSTTKGTGCAKTNRGVSTCQR
jgi:hypothetical protein